MAYASKTEVSAEKTQAEIKALLMRAGAVRFMTMDDPGQSAIAFELRNRRIRFTVLFPSLSARAVAFTAQGQQRNTKERDAAYQQIVRSRWRALQLCIKAKLEAIEIGITDFDSEFLAHIITPGGQTVMERIGNSLDTLPPGPLLLG